MSAGGRAAQGQVLLFLPFLGLTVNREAEARCPPPAIQTDTAHSLDRERMPEESNIHGNVIP